MLIDYAVCVFSIMKNKATDVWHLDLFLPCAPSRVDKLGKTCDHALLLNRISDDMKIVQSYFRRHEDDDEKALFERELASESFREIVLLLNRILEDFHNPKNFFKPQQCSRFAERSRKLRAMYLEAFKGENLVKIDEDHFYLVGQIRRVEIYNLLRELEIAVEHEQRTTSRVLFRKLLVLKENIQEEIDELGNDADKMQRQFFPDAIAIEGFGQIFLQCVYGKDDERFISDHQKMGELLNETILSVTNQVLNQNRTDIREDIINLGKEHGRDICNLFVKRSSTRTETAPKQHGSDRSPMEINNLVEPGHDNEINESGGGEIDEHEVTSEPESDEEAIPEPESIEKVPDIPAVNISGVWHEIKKVISSQPGTANENPTVTVNLKTTGDSYTVSVQCLNIPAAKRIYDYYTSKIASMGD